MPPQEIQNGKVLICLRLLHRCPVLRSLGIKAGSPSKQVLHHTLVAALRGFAKRGHTPLVVLVDVGMALVKKEPDDGWMVEHRGEGKGREAIVVVDLDVRAVVEQH